MEDEEDEEDGNASGDQKRKGRAIRGGELYEPSSTADNIDKDQGRIRPLSREETIWPVYLNYILNGEISDVGEIRHWGAQDRRNHETLFRLYEQEKLEQEEKDKSGGGAQYDEDDEGHQQGERKMKSKL